MHMQFLKITEIKEIFSDKGYKIERLISGIELVLLIMLDINMYKNSVEIFLGEKIRKLKNEKG